jgi:3-deoxy-D-manno-octulosonic-acid transferase
MMRAFYNLFLLLYPVGARLLSYKNEKAKKWVEGRRGLFNTLASTVKQDKSIIWIHCASLGEFEQGRPLIEELPFTFPGTKILLTFFSPSGYEVQKNYKGADYIFYLPLDSAWNATRFMDIVNPALIIFIKYDFWYYYILEAKKRKIPFILASGIFRKSQPFFQWYGNFHRQMISSFTYVFVQDHNSANLLNSISINNVAVTGDTRFDRVLAIAQQFQPIEIIERFCGSHPVIVAGSTWTEDDKELDHYANENHHIRFIIAPHDISKARIEECKSLYRNSITLSELNARFESLNEVTFNIQHLPFNTLIIDNIGLLSKLYRFAKIAYIGGGFGEDGVHNVLEAAVYGKPVVFGPVYEKYIEAVQLIESGGAFSISTALELEKQFNNLMDDELLYKQACLASKDFVLQNAGATKKIIKFIQEKRLFTT